LGSVIVLYASISKKLPDFLRAWRSCFYRMISYDFNYLPQNSFLHYSSWFFDIGVSYEGVFLIPSPVVYPWITFSTPWFCKYCILSCPLPPTAWSTTGLFWAPWLGLEPLGYLAGLGACYLCMLLFAGFRFSLAEFSSLDDMQQPIFLFSNL